jgi:hypothetical protein
VLLFSPEDEAWDDISNLTLSRSASVCSGPTLSSQPQALTCKGGGAGTMAAAQQTKGQQSSDPIYSALRNIGPGNQTADVTGFKLQRDAAIFGFEQGTFYFLQPVMGKVVGAVFVGHGVIQMTPPTDIEKNFLKQFTDRPELREPFSVAILYFTDGTYQDLEKDVKITDGQAPGDVIDKFKDHQQTLRREMKQTIELRILADLYDPSRPGFFTAFRNSTIQIIPLFCRFNNFN